jgi:hypothetical protein
LYSGLTFENLAVDQGVDVTSTYSSSCRSENAPTETNTNPKKTLLEDVNTFLDNMLSLNRL